MKCLSFVCMRAIIIHENKSSRDFISFTYFMIRLVFGSSSYWVGVIKQVWQGLWQPAPSTRLWYNNAIELICLGRVMRSRLSLWWFWAILSPARAFWAFWVSDAPTNVTSDMSNSRTVRFRIVTGYGRQVAHRISFPRARSRKCQLFRCGNVTDAGSASVTCMNESGNLWTTFWQIFNRVLVFIYVWELPSKISKLFFLGKSF